MNKDVDDTVDYRLLLHKYIHYVTACEGTDFIPSSMIDKIRHNEHDFNEDEIEALNYLSSIDQYL